MSRHDRLHLALESGNFDLPESGRILFVRAVAGSASRALPQDRCVCEQGFRPLHDELAAQGYHTVIRYEGAPVALAIVNLTRSKPETLGNIAHALFHLAPGGSLYVNGDKTDGIDSIARQAGKLLPVVELFVKSHGRVIRLDRPDVLPEPLAEWRSALELTTNHDGFATAAGMFSNDGVDPASRMLAESFGGKLHGKVADLGAGWGFLSSAALASCSDINEIELFEAEAAALEAARQNVADERARFHWADVPGLPRAATPFDCVISNPPFHSGRSSEPQIGEQFISAAGRLLKPSGTFWMVANRQLPYEAHVNTVFGQWEKVAEDRHYKIIRGRRPRRQ